MSFFFFQAEDGIRGLTVTGVQTCALPIVVDVDAFALQNAYEINYGLEPGQVVVLLNAGASAININILQGDQSVFTRDISKIGRASCRERVRWRLPAGARNNDGNRPRRSTA